VSDELGRIVRAAQSEHRLPSVAATVVVRGETVLETAVGFADDGAGREATPSTQYRIGSITKTFTAAAVMLLADEGKVSLDDLLGAHVEEAGDRPLSIRRLLSHSSGLQREPPGNTWESLAFPSVPELLARLDEVEQVLEPGASWHYSNVAFVLLGELVARVSGLPYQRFVEERLIGLAGLTRTSWSPAEPVTRGYYVDPYSGVLRPEADIAEVSAAGGLWSTVGDLCRWGAWLRDRETMQALQAMADQESWLYGSGLGLLLHRRGDRILYGHDGAMPGFLASLACSRKEDVQAAVLTNASTPGGPVVELALRLADRAIELNPREPELWRGHDAPPREIAELLGSWWSEGSQFLFTWRDGHLEAQIAGAPSRLKPSVFEQEGPDRFRVASGRERGERLEVVRDDAGAVAKLYWATYPFTRDPQTFGDG
jgi:CubicO group peptidase (beta-lactamase class C family)